MFEFKFKAPQEVELTDFLVKECGFNPDRVANGIKKLKEARADGAADLGLDLDGPLDLGDDEGPMDNCGTAVGTEAHTWLFNLRDDPSESVDLSDEYPEVLAKIKARLDHVEKELVIAMDVDPDTLTYLRHRIHGTLLREVWLAWRGLCPPR